MLEVRIREAREDDLPSILLRCLAT